MGRGLRLAAATGALVLAAATAPAQPAGPGASGRARWLSGPAPGDAAEVAREHLQQRVDALGIARADLDRAVLRHRRSSPRSGVTTLVMRQELHGLEVVGADLGISVGPDGRVLTRWSRLVRNLADRAPPPVPQISPLQALASAAAELGYAVGLPPLVSRSAREASFAAGGLSRDPIPVELVYWRDPDGGVALAWQLVIRPPDGRHWWELTVDAGDGRVRERADWIARDDYRVFAHPVHHPDLGARVLEVDPSDPTASPFGWHDDDGDVSPDFTDTRGNNVHAQEDVNGNDAGGFRPSGGGSLVFDFPLDLTQPPSAYQSAAITNLYYWNNLAHDHFYAYGFDEPSGNFQENDYGNGGLDSDHVWADAQDGSDTNNAQFGTPPDGLNPEMEMFVWLVGARVSALSPASIAGPRQAGEALFGPAVDGTGVSGTLVAAEDPDEDGGASAFTGFDACSPLTNGGAVSGNIALVDRGECTFVTKVNHCQDAGAIGVVIANLQGEDVLNMSGTDPGITIPSLLVGNSDGAALRNTLPGVTVELRSLPDRDSSLDAGVVLHEYGHGVSNRLTGGPGTVDCLGNRFGDPQVQSGALGEGWSDFFALAFTAEASDLSTDPQPIGDYSDANVRGIRSAPYSADLVASPVTFAEGPGRLTAPSPHPGGEIWAQALWEAYWELTAAYGFDSDLRDGSGGNNRAIGLVVDALSLQPCDPSFVDARDAIFAADLATSGGADECLLWDAFAKRGLGVNADDGGGANSTAVTADFSVPAQCDAYCGDGALQGGEECDDDNRIDFDGCHSVCLLESTLPLMGTAEGGSVSVTVEGVVIAVVTSNGQSAETVAQNLADAINADPTLMGLGISAQAQGATLVTGGSIDASSIDDPGFAPVFVPALAPTGHAALILGLALTAVLAGRRRRVGARR